MTDSDEAIVKKIRSAVTDSDSTVTWDPQNRPGIAGLLRIQSGYTGESVQDIAKRFERKTGIRDLKAECADAIIAGVRDFREQYSRILQDGAFLREKEAQGASRARERAAETMTQVRRLVGM